MKQSCTFQMTCQNLWGSSTKSLNITELKSVAREMWGTHDVLQAQLPGNEVAKAHRQLWSLKIWIDEFPNGSFKISLCIWLETMEIQWEQLVLFESGEMLFSLVKSKGCVCISTEREVFFRKLTLNTWSGAIFYNKKTPREKNLSIFKTRYSYEVLAFNILSGHLFVWKVSFEEEAYLTLQDHQSPIAQPARCMTLQSVHVGALFSRCFWF